MPKLTQALFLINPDEFLPCDAVSAFATCGNQKSVKDWTTYRRNSMSCDNASLGAIHSRSTCSPTCSTGSRIHSRSQVRTGRFERTTTKPITGPICATENVVWTKDGLPAGCADPKEPRPGDAVFVRYRRQGRGIGVVQNQITRRCGPRQRAGALAEQDADLRMQADPGPHGVSLAPEARENWVDCVSRSSGVRADIRTLAAARMEAEEWSHSPDSGG